MTRFGEELIQSAREALDIAKGRAKAAKKIDVELVDVAQLRKKMKLSQTAFADKFGLSAASVKDWEQGRRYPDATARILLKVIAKSPRVVEEAIRG